MFDWIGDVVSGVGNVLQGKSWDGDDPDAIRAQAQSDLAKQQAETNKILEAQNQAIASAQQSSKNLMLLAGAGLAGYAIYIFSKKKRRRF